MKTKNSSNTKILTITIAFAVILLILNFYQFYRSEYVSGRRSPYILKNEQLSKTLASARIEINKYKGISEELDKVVKEAIIKINEKDKKIGDLSVTNSKLKEDIIEIKEQYLESIDSLLLVTEIDNVGLESTIEQLEDEIKELNVKIGNASLLSADNIKATPLKEKQHGYASETALAKKVKVVKVCFDIPENRVANKGLYDVYMRIISPDGHVLFLEEDGDKKVKHPLIVGKVNYSYNELLKYNNGKLNKCLRWHVSELLKPGVYVAELFTEDNMLGTTTFTVK